MYPITSTPFHEMRPCFIRPTDQPEMVGKPIDEGSILNGWFAMENPIEVDDDWGYPHFRKPPYLVGEFNHLEKYEFVSWDYDIPNI